MVQEGKSHSVLAKEHGVTRTTITKLMKNANKLSVLQGEIPSCRGRKSMRLGANATLESELFKWYTDTSRQTRVSGCMIKAKAAEMSLHSGVVSFKASNGWLDGFKSRYQISSRRGAAAAAAAAATGGALPAMPEMQQIEGMLDESRNVCIGARMSDEDLPVHGPNASDELEQPFHSGGHVLPEAPRTGDNLQYCSRGHLLCMPRQSGVSFGQGELPCASCIARPDEAGQYTPSAVELPCGDRRVDAMGSEWSADT